MKKRRLTTEERKRLAHAFAGMRADVGELRLVFEAAAERRRQPSGCVRRKRTRVAAAPASAAGPSACSAADSA